MLYQLFRNKLSSMYTAKILLYFYPSAKNYKFSSKIFRHHKKSTSKGDLQHWSVNASLKSTVVGWQESFVKLQPTNHFNVWDITIYNNLKGFEINSSDI